MEPEGDSCLVAVKNQPQLMSDVRYVCNSVVLTSLQVRIGVVLDFNIDDDVVNVRWGEMPVEYITSIAWSDTAAGELVP